MAKMMRRQTEGHEFYCMKCGHQTIPLARKINHAREKFHRKKLYCPWCKLTLNCIEVRNYAEKLEFLEMFEKGDFKDEVEESLRACGASGVGEKHLG